MQLQQLEQLIDEKQLAEITGKALQTIRNDRCKKKGVPYIKLGRSIRYSLSDIARYIDENRIEVEN